MLHTFAPLTEGAAVSCAHQSPSGVLVSFGGTNGAVAVWSCHSWPPRQLFCDSRALGGQCVVALGSTDFGDQLLAAATGRSVQVFNVESGAVVWQTATVCASSICIVALCPWTHSLFVGCDAPHLHSWTKEQQPVWAPGFRTPTPGALCALVVVGAGSQLVGSTVDGKLLLWHTGTSDLLATIESGNSPCALFVAPGTSEVPHRESVVAASHHQLLLINLSSNIVDLLREPLPVRALATCEARGGDHARQPETAQEALLSLTGQQVSTTVAAEYGCSFA